MKCVFQFCVQGSQPGPLMISTHLSQQLVPHIRLTHGGLVKWLFGGGRKEAGNKPIFCKLGGAIKYNGGQVFIGLFILWTLFFIFSIILQWAVMASKRIRLLIHSTERKALSGSVIFSPSKSRAHLGLKKQTLKDAASQMIPSYNNLFTDFPVAKTRARGAAQGSPKLPLPYNLHLWYGMFCHEYAQKLGIPNRQIK